MKTFALALCILALTGTALATDPEMSYGTAQTPIVYNQRPDVCQWGFVDESVGWGYSLYYAQQLGIDCPGPFTVVSVGFYCEFASAGNIDVVIFDNGVEVSRTPVYAAAGDNNYDITDVNINGTACMMLCPTSFDGVCGEDMASPPWHSYWSSTCTCQSLFTDVNEVMWMNTEDPTPAEPVTWGSIKNLFW